VSYITNPNPPLPNTPSHRAIWHYGLGDAQVTWLGAHALALSAGAVMFKSQTSVGNESLAHFSFVPDDAVLTSGNAIVGFDYGFPTVPFVNVPPTDGIDAHECPRRTPSAQEMMAHFFITGALGGGQGAASSGRCSACATQVTIALLRPSNPPFAQVRSGASAMGPACSRTPMVAARELTVV